MKALIIVDIQNDFLPGGALAVHNGDAVIPVINKLQSQFDLVVAAQDWHPEKNIHSYSGFFDNGKKKATGIIAYLKGRNITEIFVTVLPEIVA